MDFFSRKIDNGRGMTKKFSHNHSQPRNLQHNTLIIKKKFNAKQHIHIYVTKKLKPTIGVGVGMGWREAVNQNLSSETLSFLYVSSC